MLATLLAGALLQPPPPPRLREVLENGVRMVVERTDAPGQASMVLAASTAGLKLTADTHGLPHLIEHLAARGSKEDIDRRLERQGMTLTAMTTRDAVVFEVQGAPAQMPFAALVLGEIARSLEATPERIALEAKLIKEEMALAGSKGALANAAWKEVFGEEGRDPMGTLSVIESATPDQVREAHRALFAGRNLAVALAGDIDVEAGAGRIRENFGILPAGPEFEAPLRSAAFRAMKLPGGGGARAALTEGADSVPGLALLGAALTVQQRWPGVSLAYNPSLWRSLIVLTSDSGAAFAPLDQLSPDERKALHGWSILLLESYFGSFRRTPSRLARFQAQISLQNPTMTLDRLLALVRAITPDQAGEALEAFTAGRALEVGS